MKKLKTYLDRGLDSLESDIATLLLIFVITGFLITIFARYLFLVSFPKMNELIVITFTWITFFSSPYAVKRDSHVSFTVVYASLSDLKKAVLDAVSKALIIVILGILLVPSWETVLFYHIRKTAMLKLSFQWIYMPFMFFIITSLYHYIMGFIDDIKKLVILSKAFGKEHKA